MIIDTQFIRVSRSHFLSAIITDGTSYIKHVLSSYHFSSVKGNIINAAPEFAITECTNYKLAGCLSRLRTGYRIRCFIKREWFISTTYRPCILYIWSLFVRINDATMPAASAILFRHFFFTKRRKMEISKNEGIILVIYSWQRWWIGNFHPRPDS